MRESSASDRIEDMSLTLYDLPHTAWDRVAYYVSDDLDTLLRLSTLSKAVQAICRPHTSAFFRKSVPAEIWEHKWLRNEWANHSLVHMVLNGDIDPTYIQEYECIKQYSHYDYVRRNGTDVIPFYPHRFMPTPTARPGLPRPGFEHSTERQICHFDLLIRSAIDSSRWVSPEQREHVFQRFCTGDKDAAGIILLPLLKNLRAVNPPIKGGLCAELFRRVACESRHLGLPECSSDIDDYDSCELIVDHSDTLPFPELLVLYVEPNWSTRTITTFWLDNILPFLGIPSLRRIVLHGVRDWEYEDWPPPGDLPPIICPEIYFAQSSVPRDTAFKFSEYLAGPCTLMQWCQVDRYWFPPLEQRMDFDPTWDHLRVEIKDSGERHVWTSLECEGGRPGYRYAWVSWLWHRKMQDWKLLDQEFSFEEGDSDDDELSGMI
jgi:hypothetical protein